MGIINSSSEQRNGSLISKYMNDVFAGRLELVNSGHASFSAHWNLKMTVGAGLTKTP
jgi:hypothetical protein